MDTVLFLCTGNYYRSRFAEEYFNHRAILLGAGWRADSRGLMQNMSSLRNVGPISNAVLVKLRALKITPIMASRMPSSVSIRDFHNATKIIALCEREHRKMMTNLFPMYEEMIDYWHIEDMPVWPAHRTLPMIQNNVDNFIRANSDVFVFKSAENYVV